MKYLIIYCSFCFFIITKLFAEDFPDLDFSPIIETSEPIKSTAHKQIEQKQAEENGQSQNSANSAPAIETVPDYTPKVHKSESQELCPYDQQLSDLYSYLGALHYLHNLCYDNDQKWRNFALKLDISEHLNSSRRQALYASFNGTYRSFATYYSTCSEQAKTAYNIYKAQLMNLASEILSKLGYQDN